MKNPNDPTKKGSSTLHETPRHTRSWPWGITRWSTSYRDAPINWSFIHVLDVVPLFVVGLVFIDSRWFDPLLGAAMLWCAGRLVYRRHARGRRCARSGHVPYRPVPEVARYRCWYCDSWLTEDEVVAQAERLGEYRQSYYSDRR